MIVAGNADFPAKQLAIKDFLRWMLNEGQTYVEVEGFARLPTAIVEQEQRAIDEIP
jgi:ABC-type phosphate transport system substrate-binding protein